MSGDRKIGLEVGLDGAGEVSKNLDSVAEATRRVGESAQEAGAQAEQGLEKVTAGSKRVADEAMRAGELSKGGWAEFGKAVREAAPELDNVAKAAFRVNDSLRAMAATDSADRIERVGIKGQLAFNLLTESIERARAAGVEIGPEVDASVQAMGQGLATQAQRAADLAKRADEAAAQFRAMGAAGAGAGEEIAGGMGAASGAVAAAAEQLRAAAAGSATLEERVNAAVAAVARLEAVGNSPVGLGRALLQAEIQTQALEEEMTRARAAGMTFTAPAEAALKSLQGRTEEATVKLGQLKAGKKDIAAASMVAAAAEDLFGAKVAASISPVTRLLGQSEKLVLGLAGIGMATHGVEVAFEAGKKAGELLDEGLKHVGIDLGEVAAKAVEAAQHIELAGSAADGFAVHMEGGLGASRRALMQIDALDEGLSRLGLHLVDPVRAMETFQKQAGVLGDRLEQMQRAGESFDALLERNGKALYEWAKDVERAGVDVSKFPPVVQQLIAKVLSSGEAFDKATAANDRFAGSIAQAAQRISSEYAKEVNEADHATQAAIARAERELKALNDLHAGDADYAAKKKAIEDDLASALSAASMKRLEATKREEEASGELTERAREQGTTVTEALKAWQAHREAVAADTTAAAAAKTQADALKTGVDGLGGALASATTPAERLAQAVKGMPDPMGRSAVGAAALRESLSAMQAILSPFGVAMEQTSKGTQNFGTAAGMAVGHVQLLTVPVVQLAAGVAGLEGHLVGLPTKIATAGEAAAHAALGVHALAAAQERLNAAMQASH